MSGSFFKGNRWPLKRVRILCLPRILLGEADFWFLIKAHITRKKINSPYVRFFFRELCWGGYQVLIAISLFLFK